MGRRRVPVPSNWIAGTVLLLGHSTVVNASRCPFVLATRPVEPLLEGLYGALEAVPS